MRAPWTSWVRAVRLSTYSPLPMTLVCSPLRAERTEAVDDGEAPDWNDPEMGKTRQWSHRRRGVGNLTGSGAGWAYTRQRITGGAEGWRDGWPSVV